MAGKGEGNQMEHGVGEQGHALFSLGLLMIFCSALRTTFRTRGLPSSVLYAPTPKLIF